MLYSTIPHGGNRSPPRQPLPLQSERADDILSATPVIKTFIVEDSPVILDSLVAMLEEMVPVTVVGTADDEASAVRWLNDPANPHALVIIDIFLKRGSGLGVLKALQGAHPGRSLVVLSNYATADMRRTCLQLGADRVFDKSNEIDALVQYCDCLAAGETGPGLLA